MADWVVSGDATGWGAAEESSGRVASGFESSSFEPSSALASGDARNHDGETNVQGGNGGFACFNCGQEGHAKADCQNASVPREFTGTCRTCNETGHRASECPLKPPMQCNNCKEEGHSAVECKNARKVDYAGVESVEAEIAWEQIKQAAEERDLDEILEAALKYFKATPETTYVQMEKGFRVQELPVYLIALEKELSITYTNMDLQGNLGKKYSVTWRLSDKPMRPKEKEGWPASIEDNLERLADAGTPVDRGIPKCSNCDQMGHIMKHCPDEKQENADKAVIMCFNCEQIGHRIRDCPEPRIDKFACRNCLQSGHTSKDCPEPRSAGNVACHNCGQEGHRKQDCTNERVIVCRNCDEEGHTGRDCPKPRDYSRVKCSNCHQMGHTKVRCKEPIKDEGDDNGGSGGDAGANNFDGGKYTAAEPIIASGGGVETAADSAWETTVATGNW